MQLSIVQGDRHHAVRIGPATVVASPRDDPPFHVTTQVFEEDTWRLLSAPCDLSGSQIHPIRLMTAVCEDRPAPPGEVLVAPRGWLAVVCDLDQDPICRPDWVAQALRHVLDLAQSRHPRSLALPLLGSCQCGLPWEISLQLLATELHRRGDASPTPLQIWLQPPTGEHPKVVRALTAFAERPYL